MLASRDQEGYKSPRAAAYWKTVRLYRQRKKANAEGFFIPVIPSGLWRTLVEGDGVTEQ